MRKTLFALLNAFVLLGGVMLLIARPDNTEENAEAASSEIEIADVEQLTESWWNAVRENDAETAVKIAKDLVEATDGNEDYEPFFNDIGLNHLLLHAPFNELDFMHWRRMYIFEELAARIVSQEDADEVKVKKIFNAVRSKIQPHEKEQNKTLWPEQIWRNAAGLCDHQAWVCSMLYRVLGFDTMLVLLFDENDVSPHTA